MRFPTALVFATWIVMVASLTYLVATYGSPIPAADDCGIVPRFGDGRPVSAEWLWSPHNEHRIPLPRLVYVGMLKLTGDIRSLMFLQIALLASASLALILAARRMRGRTSVTDAFFPFLLLGWGHFENVLTAFQIALVLPAVIAAMILALIAGGPLVPDRRSTIRIGILLLALPLCGLAGLIPAFPIAVWLGLAGTIASKSSDGARRGPAILPLTVSASTLVLIGLYFVGYSVPTEGPTRADLTGTITHAIDVLAIGAGPLRPSTHSFARWLLVGLGLVTLALLLVRSRGEGRWRSLGILACAVGSLALVSAIGWGREEFVSLVVPRRYVTLAAPFLAILYMAWSEAGTGLSGRIVQGVLCLGMGATLPQSIVQARAYAEKRLHATERLVHDADAGLLPEELAERYADSFYMGVETFAEVLERLRILGMPPYRIPGEGPELNLRAARPFFHWKFQPIEARSDQPIARRTILGTRAVLVHAPAEIVLEIPAGARTARGGFGVDPLAYSKPKRSLDGLRFTIERASRSDDRELLLEQILDPASRTEDRSLHNFSLELPAEPEGRLVLRVSSAGEIDDSSMDWGFWTAPEFD